MELKREFDHGCSECSRQERDHSECGHIKAAAATRYSATAECAATEYSTAGSSTGTSSTGHSAATAGCSPTGTVRSVCGENGSEFAGRRDVSGDAFQVFRTERAARSDTPAARADPIADDQRRDARRRRRRCPRQLRSERERRTRRSGVKKIKREPARWIVAAGGRREDIGVSGVRDAVGICVVITTAGTAMHGRSESVVRKVQTRALRRKIAIIRERQSKCLVVILILNRIDRTRSGGDGVRRVRYDRSHTQTRYRYDSEQRCGCYR